MARVKSRSEFRGSRCRSRRGSGADSVSLKVDEHIVRQLFANEPGVFVICFPEKGKRVNRTLRIPEAVFLRVVTRLAKVA